MNPQKHTIFIVSAMAFSMLFLCNAFAQDSLRLAAQKENWWASWNIKSRPDLTQKYFSAMLYENCRLVDGEVVLVVSKENWILNGWQESRYEQFQQILLECNAKDKIAKQNSSDSHDSYLPLNFQENQEKYFAGKEATPQRSPIGKILEKEGFTSLGIYSKNQGIDTVLMELELNNTFGKGKFLFGISKVDEPRMFEMSYQL